METYVDLYCNSDELKTIEYGDTFLNDLRELVNNNNISEKDAEDIINCLVDVDEIRILLASELRECIIHLAEDKRYDNKLLELFFKLSDVFDEEHSRAFKTRAQSIIYDLISGDLTTEKAIDLIISEV